MNMNKVMTTAAKVGALCVGAFTIWKLGNWHGEGAGMVLGYATEHGGCTDLEGGIPEYLEHVEKIEKNLFGKMFVTGANEMAKMMLNAENN